MNNNPATYDYLVPTQVLDGATNNGPIRVGSTVSLWTNGHVVDLDVLELTVTPRAVAARRGGR